MKPHVHFVGFRADSEYWNAVAIWGKPDFIHLTHDHRMYGDIDTERDTVVFGSKAREDKISPFSWQDHELW